MGNLLSICLKIDTGPNNNKYKSHVNSPRDIEYRFQAPIKTRSVSPNKFENIDLE
jgi:hypothetical protein